MHITDADRQRAGRSLVGYTCRSKDSYDPVFDAAIRQLRPDWFEKTSIPKKVKLLAIARSGANRPSSKSKDKETAALGRVLGFYTLNTTTGRSCYDPVFDAEIRKLRPD